MRNDPPGFCLFEHLEFGLGWFANPLNGVREPGIRRVLDVLHLPLNRSLHETHACTLVPSMQHSLPDSRSFRDRLVSFY